MNPDHTSTTASSEPTERALGDIDYPGDPDLIPAEIMQAIVRHVDAFYDEIEQRNARPLVENHDHEVTPTTSSGRSRRSRPTT